MKISKLALALVVLMPASAALAQEYNAPQMQEGLTMIQTNAEQAFKQYGIDADPKELSLAQLAEIIGVLSQSGKDGGGNVKSQIEAALRRK